MKLLELNDSNLIAEATIYWENGSTKKRTKEKVIIHKKGITGVFIDPNKGVRFFMIGLGVEVCTVVVRH